MRTTAPVDIFFSYASQDEDLRLELEKHLRLLERDGLVRSYSSRSIGAGQEWRGEIDRRLDEAQLILLLVSPDLLASDYLFDVELERALARERAVRGTVMLLLLRPYDITGSPLAALRTLPSSGVPVTSWPNRDAAFARVALELREELQARRAPPNPPRAHLPTAPGR